MNSMYCKELTVQRPYSERLMEAPNTGYVEQGIDRYKDVYVVFYDGCLLIYERDPEETKLSGPPLTVAYGPGMWVWMRPSHGYSYFPDNRHSFLAAPA